MRSFTRIRLDVNIKHLRESAPWRLQRTGRTGSDSTSCAVFHFETRM